MWHDGGGGYLLGMDHAIRIIRTDHEDPLVPSAFHATCRCGWASEAHDEQSIHDAVLEHEQGDHQIPIPASPSPVKSEPV